MTPYPVTSYRTHATDETVTLTLALDGRSSVALRFTDREGLSEFIAELQAARVKAWRGEAKVLRQVGVVG